MTLEHIHTYVASVSLVHNMMLAGAYVASVKLGSQYDAGAYVASVASVKPGSQYDAGALVS